MQQVQRFFSRLCTQLECLSLRRFSVAEWLHLDLLCVFSQSGSSCAWRLKCARLDARGCEPVRLLDVKGGYMNVCMSVQHLKALCRVFYHIKMRWCFQTSVHSRLWFLAISHLPLRTVSVFDGDRFLGRSESSSF